MNKSKTYPWYFALGALLFYILLFVLPSVIGIGYSFTDWSGYSDTIHFVGWDNFVEVFSSDRNYMEYIGHTIWFTVVSSVLKTVVALLLALMLCKGVKALNFHRSVMYLPSVLSILIVGMVFSSILEPRNGFLNTFFRAIGADGLAQKWLTDPKFAMWSVIGVDAWRGAGYIMTILIVGILSIPPTYHEAAAIDGANAFHQFWNITLPMLKPTLAVVTVLNVLYGLKVFDIVYALTNGGPGHRTEVMYTAVFKEFSQGRYAVGTALSSVMMLIMLVVGIFIVRILTKDEVQE